jgi:predicted phosphoadenosine phosphosulfate sulfurtransferase
MATKAKQKIRQYESIWIDRCYKDGIPDSVPLGVYDKVPSWQKVAMCILKNDLHLTGLGFKGFESVYYGELKRIELNEKDNQLRLF